MGNPEFPLTMLCLFQLRSTRRPLFLASVLWLVCAALVWSSLAAFAQATAATAAPSAGNLPIGPAFEVATIRPTDTSNQRDNRWYGLEITSSGRLNVSSMNLSGLVGFAYSQPNTLGKVKGGPSWAESEKFDIAAKVDGSQLTGWDKLSQRERGDRVRPMLRQLLDERFHLKLHSEIHEESVYALVQAKGGAKLQKVDAPDESDSKSMADVMRENAIRSPDKARPGSMMMSGNGNWEGNQVKVSALSGQIAYESHVDTFVVDETGLDGYYNFSMKIDRSKDAPDFQDQLEQQLGLKLVARKRPVVTWIIDSADKPSQDGASLGIPAIRPALVALLAGYSGGPTVTTK